MNPGHTGGNHSPSNSEQQQQQQQDGAAIVSDEILARRIKNRERQRRYRARKRLELDHTGKAFLSGQHATLQTDIHFNLNPPPPSPSSSSSHLSSYPEARAYNGGRNWKKDAREAGNPVASGTRGRRRNWKADARNKADKQA